MDILKRELAPIPAEAWTEIDEQAIRSLKAILSARKVIDVTGPMGTDFPGVPEGRLEFPKKQAENILGGQVVLSPYLTGKHENEAFMLSQRGGDLEIILGQDMAVGYDSHSSDKVKLYYTESFTFRILEPAAVLHYTASE